MFLLNGEESCVKIDYNKRPEMVLICWLCSHHSGFVILAKKKSCKRDKYETLLLSQTFYELSLLRLFAVKQFLKIIWFKREVSVKV